MAGAAADVRRAEPLRHDALTAELAGVAVDDVTAVREGLDQPQPWPAGAQQARQRRLARLQRFAPKVLAIKLKQVEGVEEYFGRPPPVAQQREHREPVPVAAHRLAVD